MITDMYDAVKAFQVKLLLLEKQIRQCSLPHFPFCQTMSNQVDANMFPNMYFADKLNILRADEVSKALFIYGALETSNRKKGILNCFATHLQLMLKLSLLNFNWS